MTLEQVKTALADRNVRRVAEATGLNAHTIYRLIQGKTRPNRVTLRVLAQYLLARVE